jgi:acetylornithine deacetylase/succinyl-diaminopimelate desuccinylase-like protein
MFDLLAVSRDLIAADTVSHKGTSAAVDVLLPLYRAAGLETRVQEVVREGIRHQNLFGQFAGKDPRGLLLVTHLDTVDPGPLELWTETSPHTLAKKDDRVFGLGSADTKLDAICKLIAAQSFRGQQLRRSLQLLGTFEEEIGCKGARHFLDTPEFTAQFVACSEPSELTIIRAHKGYAVVVCTVQGASEVKVAGPFLRVEVDGKAAHSSTPTLGINAIEKALTSLPKGCVSFHGGSVANKVPARCTLVSPGAGGTETVAAPVDATPTVQLGATLFGIWKRLALAQEPRVNPTFDPDRCVVNWGVAHVDGARGQFTFDCRLLPGHDPQALTQDFIREATAAATAVGARLEVFVDRASPAMELREPSELLNAAREASKALGLDDVPKAKPTNTEAGVFASAGTQAIVFGPGRSTGNAHCANEHNQFSQMEKAIEFHRALIARLCA